MRQSNLIQLLQSLNPKEFRKLGQLVHSPIYNKNDKIKGLYDLIAQVYPNWENEGLEKETVYSQLFPNVAYNDKYLRALMSDLSKLAQQLLVQLQLDADPFLQQHLLFQAANQRGMNKLRQAALDDMALLDNPASEDLLYNRMEAEKMRYEHLLKTRNRNTDNALQQVLDSLDAHYVHQKLKFACEALNRSNILAEKYDLLLLNELLAQLQQGAFNQYPLIRAYYQVLLTITQHQDEGHYQQLKEVLAREGKNFPLSEAKMLYAYAQNYCIRKINTGGSGYLKELFDLYRQLLASKLILDGQYITQWDYKNIVSVSLRLGEMDWAEQFIHDYKVQLHPLQKSNAVQYNIASLHFYKKQFSKVAQILQRVQFTDVFYNLDSRSLLMKTYYELGEFEALFQFCDTFSNYLRRTKQVSAYQQTIYLNLVKFTTRLAKHKINNTGIPPKLQEQVNTGTALADATWLKAKAAELL